MTQCDQKEVKDEAEQEIIRCLELTPSQIMSFCKDIYGNAPHASHDVQELLKGEITFIFACLRICLQDIEYESAVKLIKESSERIRFFMAHTEFLGSLETDSIYQVYTILSASFELLPD